MAVRRGPWGEGIAANRRPGKACAFADPAGPGLEAVGRDADHFELGGPGEAFGQVAQLVAGEQELLQIRACAKRAGQCGDGIVGQCQPAERRRQGRGRNLGNAGVAAADLAEVRAGPESLGQDGEAIAGAEEDAEAMKPPEILRQGGELIAGEIEHFQRIGETENLVGKFGQALVQPQHPRAGEVPATEAGERHGRFRRRRPRR